MAIIRRKIVPTVLKNFLTLKTKNPWKSRVWYFLPA